MFGASYFLKKIFFIYIVDNHFKAQLKRKIKRKRKGEHYEGSVDRRKTLSDERN